MSTDPEVLEEVAEPITDADLFAALVQRHDAWVAAASSVGTLSAGGRDRLITAEVALAELEGLALRAGLLLADALAGHAPHVRAQLVRFLNEQTASDTVPPEPAISGEVHVVDVQETTPGLAVAEPASPTPISIMESAQPPTPAPEPLPPPELQPPSVPPPPPVPVTDATMAMLKASLSGELKAAPVSVIAKSQHRALESLRKLLGDVPSELKTRSKILSALKQVELTTAEVSTWEHLSLRGRRILAEGVAARTRAIQEAAGQVKEMEYVDDVNRRTTLIMHELRKEVVPEKRDRVAWGLAYMHGPRSETWLDDARLIQQELDDELGIKRVASQPPTKFNADDAFRRLREDVLTLSTTDLCARIRDVLTNGVSETDKRFVKLLEPRLPEIMHDRALAKLTRSVAGALAAEDKDEESPRPIDANWYGFAHTTGMNAVIVGGDGRSERAVVLQSAFRFAGLDWPDIPKNSPGKANALVGQVRKGKYQIVICLQPFISHKLTDQLFDVDVPGTKVILAQGYGT